MTKYEALYIIDAELDEAAAKETIEKFSGIVTNNGGTVDLLDEWGKRRLAYPINYKNDGYYVLMQFSASAEFPSELERNFKITDSILRYLVTRIA